MSGIGDTEVVGGLAYRLCKLLGLYQEDVAHASGDYGIQLLAVRKDSAAALAGTDGDYIPLIVDATGHLYVNATSGGRTLVVAGTFTRPADTTAYAAGDAVNDSTSAPAAITFASCARATGGSGYITSAQLNKSTVTTTNAQFRLRLYANTPSSLANDNAASTRAWADRALRCIGYIDFTTATAGADCAISTGTLNPLMIPFVAVGTSLYGKLEALAAYAPGNAEVFYITLGVEQN